HITYHDFMKFEFHTDYFKYQIANIFLNTLTSRSEDSTDSSLIYMIHTLEFRTKQKLSFTISENVMYRSQIGAELKFMNPSFIYHNLNNRDMFNAIAYAEVNYVPTKGLEFYGQFTLDQATAPNEDDSQDPAFGYMIGSSYSFEIPKAIVSCAFEFSYTSPLLYRRDLVDFIEVQRYFHHNREINGYTYSSYSLLFNYIGFPFGGDSIMVNWNTNINVLGIGKAYFKASFLEKGSFNIFESHNSMSHINTDKPKSDRGKTPTYNNKGEILCVLALSTGFDADMSSFFNYPDVTIGLYADYITTWNRHRSGVKNNLKSDLQVTLSTSFKF
ncbi:MAG: hypothetical protein HUK23_05860, partial [Sphaerochaetaceae bacterium]|nr:hypothetical protein [Sphaerochaetaceae bacterium]